MGAQENLADSRKTLDTLMEISNILNTGLDPETLSICLRLCESGVNPEALALVIRELRRESAAVKSSRDLAPGSQHKADK